MKLFLERGNWAGEEVIIDFVLLRGKHFLTGRGQFHHLYRPREKIGGPAVSFFQTIFLIKEASCALLVSQRERSVLVHI